LVGHKSLETTMRYLVPATDVQGKLDQVKIPGVPSNGRAPGSPPNAKRLDLEEGGLYSRRLGVKRQAL
jgi:hypothetical protein